MALKKTRLFSCVLAVAVLASLRSCFTLSRSIAKPRCQSGNHALPDGFDWIQQELAHGHVPWDTWTFPDVDLRPMPPAYAETQTLPTQTLPTQTLPELDPTLKYIYGQDGEVLRDPSSKKPITDDWFNQAVGIQVSILKALDSGLRGLGVQQAFGWVVFTWTFVFKCLLYPFEQGTLRMSAMTKMLEPKIKQIKERFPDDEDRVKKRTQKLYDMFGLGIAGGCLPILVQLPILFTLFYSWRRLRAERFEHFSDPWLWVPSLAQPNPDFDWKLDWLLEFNDAGDPVIGWDIFLRQLILPAIVVGIVFLKNQEPEPEKAEDKKNPITSNFSVILTAWITLELPQVMSIYYLAFHIAGVAETEFSKYQIRKEMPAFEVFERTGKFPEGNFDEVFFPASLHEACKKGNIRGVQQLLIEGDDVNAVDEVGASPIYYAASFGSLPLVSVLCLSGADLLTKDQEENSLLHIAAAADHIDVFKYLVTYASEMDAVKDEFADNKWATWENKRGYSVMDIAAASQTGKVSSFINVALGLAPLHKEVVAAAAPALTVARARAID